MMENIFNKIYKTSSLKQLDEYTIEHEPISSLDLMERAARTFADKLLKKFTVNSIFNIFAGPGNNGGDGFAVGRMLRQEGCGVVVYVVTSAKLTPDCETNRRRYLATGGTCIEIAPGQNLRLSDEGILIDALFGAGLNRPIEGWTADVICQMNESGQTKVALDIPSGLMGEDNTNNNGAIFRADYTFTFQFPKLAFMFADNFPYVGQFEVLDIHLHPTILKVIPSDWYYLTEKSIAACLPMPGKFAHKGTFGHALLVVGSYAMMGAAVLAGKGAIRSGTGLLTLHVPRALKELIHFSLPEALVETDQDEYCFSGITELNKYRAIGIGPGIGQNEKSVAGLRELLFCWQGKMVIDADALNILAAHPELLKKLPPDSVLTPHPGEWERLVGKSRNDFDRLNKLSTFASLYHVYVLLKGAHTVVATPEGKCYFNMTGNPGMAKGGAGDVLTGIITALLAGGLPTMEAALTGVYIHGVAGDLARDHFGIRGVRAGDIADMLGQAWKRLEK